MRMMSIGYPKPSLIDNIILIVGILEFNPQLAGQDITPANLEFGSITARRRDRREKSFSGVSTLQSNIPSSNAVHGSSFTGTTEDSIPLVCKKNFFFNI